MLHFTKAIFVLEVWYHIFRSHLSRAANFLWCNLWQRRAGSPVVSFLLIHYSICVAVLFSFIKGETSNSRPAKEFENRYFSTNGACTQFECRTILCLPSKLPKRNTDNGINFAYYVLCVLDCLVHIFDVQCRLLSTMSITK